MPFEINSCSSSSQIRRWKRAPCGSVGSRRGDLPVPACSARACPASPGGGGGAWESTGGGGGVGRGRSSPPSAALAASLSPWVAVGFCSGLRGPPPTPRGVQLRCDPFPLGAGWTYSNENPARMKSFHTTEASALSAASSQLLAVARPAARCELPVGREPEAASAAGQEELSPPVGRGVSPSHLDHGLEGQSPRPRDPAGLSPDAWPTGTVTRYRRF